MEQNEIMSIYNSNNRIASYKKPKIEVIKPEEAPLTFWVLGNIAFATSCFLSGLRCFYSYNPIFLSIFGFWLPGWGQIIIGIMAYKFKLYLDGNTYFFFGINWIVCSCYDLFPVWGWMKPLTHIEYGLHNLMCVMFIIVFFIQNLFGNSKLLIALNSSILLCFLLCTIGDFANNKIVHKISGIFNFTTAFISYYNVLAMVINNKRNRITLPLFDGTHIGQLLD